MYLSHKKDLEYQAMVYSGMRCSPYKKCFLMCRIITDEIKKRQKSLSGLASFSIGKVE